MSILDLREQSHLGLGGNMPKAAQERAQGLAKISKLGSRDDPSGRTKSDEVGEARWPFIYSLALGLAGSALVCFAIAAAIKFL